MKTKTIAAVIAVPLLTLTACGGEGDQPTNERNRAGAISALVAFAHDIDAQDYAAACDRLDSQMRAESCEGDLKSLRGEREAEHPGELGAMSEADVVVSTSATSGCAYYIAQGARAGGNLPTGSAVLVWHDDQWWVSSIGNLEGYAGESLDEDDVKAYPCD